MNTTENITEEKYDNGVLKYCKRDDAELWSNEQGKLTKIKFACGQTIEYFYDEQGRPTGCLDSEKGFKEEIAYDEKDNITVVK